MTISHFYVCLFSEIASDALKGRVFEVSLADLQNDEVAFRKFKLVVEDVQGKNCLTNFHGMNLTRDKYCSMVKKWQVRNQHSCFISCTVYITLKVYCKNSGHLTLCRDVRVYSLHLYGSEVTLTYNLQLS